MSKNNSEDLFNKWLAVIKTIDISERYLHANREEYIADLINMFKAYDIDFDEAKAYRNKVFNALITEEGKKGNGKHKGWKEKCLSDFDTVTADIYIEMPDQATSINNHLPDSARYLPEDDAIKSWLLAKYGDNCSDLMLKEAHRINGLLNIEYLVDTFDQ